MPTINDATVVNQAYDTSGNGGRKLVRLSNGWLVAVVFQVISGENGKYNFYKSMDNGVTWSLITSYDDTSGSFCKNYYAMVSVGTKIYLTHGYSTNYIKYIGFNVVNYTTPVTGIIDSILTDVKGGISLATNEAGTELHAAWASKNSTYPNSFNIRYAKGTINADGSVAWGAVEQVTTNSTANFNSVNPCMFMKDGDPYIIIEYNSITSAPNRAIVVFSRSLPSYGFYNNVMSNWQNKEVYKDTIGGYSQSSPSAVFVPQRINGLANGLLATAWHGTDSTHTTTNYIRFSKAIDDTGATWSTMQKLVPGTNASLTANRSGRLFITYEDAGVTKRIESADNGDNWSSAITVGTGTNPSSLFDLTMDISAPLTIRKGTSSVLFSGSWVVTTNSVPSGDIGQKTNKENLLTYAVTTDGTMSTITEKVNGVTIGTKTATSGQSLTLSLTQAQWDAIKFGKYADAAGGLNTIEISMGSDKWTYTFDRRLSSDADMLSAVKAVQDSQNNYLPAVKTRIAKAIRDKGGTVSNTDSLESMAAAVGGIETGKKWASGIITSASSTRTFGNQNGNDTSSAYVILDLSKIAFSPRLIYLNTVDKGSGITSVWTEDNQYQYASGAYWANVIVRQNMFREYRQGYLLYIPVGSVDTSYSWVAYE